MLFLDKSKVQKRNNIFEWTEWKFAFLVLHTFNIDIDSSETDQT